MITGHLILDNTKLCEAVEHWLRAQTMPGSGPSVEHAGTVVEGGVTKFRFTLAKQKAK